MHLCGVVTNIVKTRVRLAFSSDDQESGGKASSGQVKVQCLMICFSSLRLSSARGRLPQSPTWKCKEHCKSWNEPKDRAKVTPCLSETMQVNKSRSMRKWWRCQAAGSNCVHCIYIEWKLAQILTIRLRKYQSTNKIIKDGDISLLKLLSLLNSV